MRKNVKQAKIHIIKKHTRDAMKLRAKKGNDAQKAKNARKADRIAAEILAIKKVKNDEVTKHILTHTLNLQEILKKDSDPLTRMMARIANHKIFSKKIAEFKEKYPNYMEFLGPGRKKKAIMEWKEKKKQQKEGNGQEANESLENEKSEESDGEEASESDGESDPEQSDEINVSNTDQVENENEESEQEESLIEKVPEDNVENKINIDKKAKKAQSFKEESDKTDALETGKPEKPKKRKKAEIDVKEEAANSKKLKKKRKTVIPKVISKQAVVKKFTDILKEDESNVGKEEIDDEPTVSSIQVEKEEDPFFVTSDGQSNYLSVAPLRNKSDDHRIEYEDNDDDNYRGNKFNNNKFSRHDPDKYFSNVSKFKNGNNFKNANARWDAPKRNGKAYDKEKPGRNANFSKFNDEQPRDKSKLFSRQSKGGIESTSNEILHPSWEAKKKQQEALKKGFQGKKIVFGDDDA